MFFTSHLSFDSVGHDKGTTVCASLLHLTTNRNCLLEATTSIFGVNNYKFTVALHNSPLSYVSEVSDWCYRSKQLTAELLTHTKTWEWHNNFKCQEYFCSLCNFQFSNVFCHDSGCFWCLFIFISRDSFHLDENLMMFRSNNSSWYKLSSHPYDI